MLSQIGTFIFLFSIIFGFSYLVLFLLAFKNRLFEKYAIYSFVGQVFFGVFSFLILLYGFITSDFSIELVAKHSSTLKPLIYKIAGTWANHEGSLLLFLFISSLYSLYIIFYEIELKKKQYIFFFQSLIYSTLSCFLYNSSNPFNPSLKFIKEGMGLNPILQDFALSIHPPLLYIGYSGTGLIFSIMMSILFFAQHEELFKLARKIILFSFGFLSFGIALGSFWAYRELGWGGFWFWDAVENSSLMPWLLLLQLLHSVKLENLKRWSILSGILLFITMLLGFFLVRSGIITSVHSFASSPERGIIMLLIIAFFAILSFGIYILKIEQIENSHNFKNNLVAIILNNMIVIVLYFIIILGSFYPILFELFSSHKISVGPNYYITTFIPLTIVLGIVCAIFSNIKFIDILLALVFTLILVFFLDQIDILLLVPIFTSSLLFITSIKISSLSMRLAHSAFAILIFAITIVSFFDKEMGCYLKKGEEIQMGNFLFKYRDTELKKEPEFVLAKSYIDVYKKNKVITTINPEMRYYILENSQTFETSIYFNLFYDVHAIVSEYDGEQIYLKLYYKPFILYIWLSSFCIGLSAFIAIRRK